MGFVAGFMIVFEIFICLERSAHGQREYHFEYIWVDTSPLVYINRACKTRGWDASSASGFPPIRRSRWCPDTELIFAHIVLSSYGHLLVWQCVFVVYFFAFSGWSSSSLAGLCFCSQRLVLLKRRCFTKGAFFVVSCIFMLRDQDQELHPHHRHDGKMILLKQCFCRLTRKHARTFWWWQVGLGGNPYVQILSKSYSLSHGQSFVGQRFLQPEMDSEAKWCDLFHHSSRLLPNYVAPSICQPMNQVLRLAWYENDILVFSQCCIAALMSKHFMIKVAERKWMKMPCLR